MAGLQAYSRKHFVTLLLLFIAGGFTVILGELLITSHTDGLQMIGVTAAALGVIIAVMGIFAVGKLRTFTVIMMFVIALCGLVGTGIHIANGGNDGERFGPPPAGFTGEQGVVAQPQPSGESDSAQAPAGAQGQQFQGFQDGQRPMGRPHGTPPPLAPLSLCGLALMAAVVMLVKQDPEPVAELSATPA